MAKGKAQSIPRGARSPKARVGRGTTIINNYTTEDSSEGDANATLAAAVIADNAIVRGDGGARGVQASQVLVDDAGNVTGANEVTITNASSDDMDMFQTNSITMMTGVVEGGVLSTGAGSTQFSISDGFGFIVDYYTNPAVPSFKKITWTGLTNIEVTVFSGNVSRIYIDAAGAVQQQATNYTDAQRRDILTIGGAATTDGVNVTNINQSQELALGIGHTVYDLINALGDLNLSGNDFSAASTDMTIQKSAGTTFGRMTNYDNSNKTPNDHLDIADNPMGFFYVYQDGSGGTTFVPSQTDIDPDQYDDGTGTLASVPNSRWTIQRIHYYSGPHAALIQYGQTIYSSQAEAEAAIDSENFTVVAGLVGGGIHTSLSVKKGTTDLTDGKQLFKHAGMFGFGIGGSSVSGTSQNLQNVYDLSTPDPETTTNATQGAVTYRNGAGADTLDVIEIQNAAGTQVLAFTGEGVAVGLDDTISAALSDETTLLSTGSIYLDSPVKMLVTEFSISVETLGTGSDIIVALYTDSVLRSTATLTAATDYRDTQTFSGIQLDKYDRVEFRTTFVDSGEAGRALKGIISGKRN